MKQHDSRVMFWHQKSLIGKFYDLSHIPRIGEQVIIRHNKYRVVELTLTPEESDASDIDIELELL